MDLIYAQTACNTPQRFKMAQRMADVVWNASILLLFLFVCSVFSHSLSISFTRDKLLDIRHKRDLRTALPSIHLANLRSLPNKTDELLLLTRTNKDFSNSAALCFTETWLSKAIPDNVHMPGYQLFRADRITELTGKTRGGGLCFYINEGWCTDVRGTLHKL